MGYWVDENVYNWIRENYPELLDDEDIYLGFDNGYYWFLELPDSLTVEGGNVYLISTRPSQKDTLIGTTSPELD